MIDCEGREWQDCGEYYRVMYFDGTFGVIPKEKPISLNDHLQCGNSLPTGCPSGSRVDGEI